MLCDLKFEHVKHITMHVVPRKHQLTTKSNDRKIETSSQKFLENLEEMFPWYVTGSRFQPHTITSLSE